MQRRQSLTDKQVLALRPMAERYAMPDPDLRGHYVRVSPNGAKSFVAVARDPFGKQIWATLGAADVLSIDEARGRARDAIKRIKGGLPAFEAASARPDSFKAIAEQYVERHLKKNNIRTRGEIERCLGKYIYPLPKADPWQGRPFNAIRRSDVAKLLDHIEDNHGARQADVCLTIIAAICNWQAARDDDYVSPVVRGMRRDQRTKRDRILTDDEIRIVWQAADGTTMFGAIVRLALLTAQRVGKIAAMRWEDIADDGTWTVPREAREKGTVGTVKLPGMARAIIRAQARVGSSPYIFAGRSSGHINGLSACKRTLDGKVLKLLRAAASDADEAKPIPGWVIHDLRRTARSLMARAGVRPDVAERVLGHAIAGVEGIYDRHTYETEKAEALARLNDLLGRILEPSPAKVVPLRGR